MAWSAKAGCTVAIKMFFDHMGLLNKALKYRKNDKISIHQFMHHKFKKHPSPKDWKNPSYFKFKVVRNPYTRAVSSYIAAINMGAFKGSFAKFLDKLGRTNLKRCNDHWKLQYTARKFDKIVKLEELTTGMAEINALIGSRFRTDFDSSHHLDKNEVVEFCGERVFRRPVKVIPQYKYFYNQLLLDKVSKLYSKDIEAYNYAIPF